MRISHITAALAFAGLVLQSAAAQREGSFDRTLTVNGAVDLKVETGSGALTNATWLPSAACSTSYRMVCCSLSK